MVGGKSEIRNPKSEISCQVVSSAGAVAFGYRQFRLRGNEMGPWMVDVTDRTELDLWLEGGPPYRAGSTVMLVRGDDSDVRSFLPNALDAAKEGTKRVVVWVKESSLLSESEQKELFGKGERVLASVIGIDGRAGGWVTRDRLRVEDAVFAFSEAEDISA